jgi:hypothetical protein
MTFVYDLLFHSHYFYNYIKGLGNILKMTVGRTVTL